jgi:hypothetical protein
MLPALTRFAVRGLMLAMIVATVLPVVSTAQETAGPEAEGEMPAEEAAPFGTPASPVSAPPLPAPFSASPSPEPTQPIQSPLPSHDWRSPGYVAVVDGRLYDPFCRPLRSVGSNVPNLMFRQGLRENLEWMRQHRMRWMRVIATGHGTMRPGEQVVPGVVEQRLAGLLREVEAFNASHPAHEAIYVLVNLTDYYEPGVPDDKYGFDHAGWCNARVLNAPWYRRGVTRYSFDQECGGGRLVDAPNYEVNYKPWVERLVAVGARSPALFGWQLGNEMKSRDTTDDGIDEAYAWYVEWMVDMTDTIRRIDRNHLVLTGTQYLAELTDYEYRPNDGDPMPRMIDGYAARFDKILRGCRQYCWNVWTLTNYDFHHYAIDDAMYLQPLGVAAIITEYGYTLGTPDEERRRFGGDRLLALKHGRARPWVDLDGVRRPYDWSTIDLLDSTGIQGVAPWASPAPTDSADPWIDLDWQRGLSLAREGDVLWQAWREIAEHLETANSQQGVSAACSTFRSE